VGGPKHPLPFTLKRKMNRISPLPLQLIFILVGIFVLFDTWIAIIIIILVVIAWCYIYNRLNNRPHYVDHRGYERDSWGDLIHRSVAFSHHYDSNKFDKPFSEYDIHHKDGNKRNNSPENLEILTRQQHKRKHGIK